MKNLFLEQFLFLLSIALMKTVNSFDFRFVSYKEALDTMKVYQNNNDDHFEAIIVDQQRNQIIIGAKNSIIRLNFHSFQLLERLQWESTINEINICRNQVQLFEECENYIRVLAVRKNDKLLLTCGTNSYHPVCIWRHLDSLSTINSTDNSFSGDGISPYNSQTPSVYEIVDSDLYSATLNQPIFGVNDPLIKRYFNHNKQLRTRQHDSNWLKNPHFIRILNIGPYVYTFFREISLEHLSCGTKIYSRVARVCKYDEGTMKYSDTFRSFSKLRFLCSNKLLNDISTFDYNELQSIYHDSSTNLIYGAFNLPQNGLVGSAICIYTINQLEDAFKSSFLVQKTNESYWLPISNVQESEKCESNQLNDMFSYSSGPILRSGILQSSFNPLLFDDIRIGHLFVDQINDIDILFVVTLDGLWLRKYSLLPEMNKKKKCLIEQIQLKPSTVSLSNWQVNRIEFISKSREIIITTKMSILKLPFARCHRFTTKSLCSSAMDPYCTWNNIDNKCIDSSISYETISSLFYTCPIVNVTSNDGWSPWFSCEQDTGEKCQCRKRICTKFNIDSDEHLCHESEVEISQCEVHGGWSSWSDWSNCPKKCGKFHRTRTRTCTNPRPKNNGRICIGSEREDELCSDIFCSNETTNFDSWTDWTVCSKSCGTGIQKRTRLCLNNIEQCNECSEEIRLCNEISCPIESVKLWSNWTRIVLKNDTNDNESVIEERVRMACSMSSSQSLIIQTDKINYRICNSDRNDCYETDSIEHWSPWSNWGECYPSCGIAGSTQTRRRTCLTNRCIGKEREQKDCSLCSSRKQQNWSCWSEWSPCLSCSLFQFSSIKFRNRTCLTNSCDEHSHEESSCFCSTFLTWSNEIRFTLLHVILISLISFLFGCLLLLCIYTLYYKRSSYQEYFHGSTTNSSASPHIAIDSETFTTLLNPNQNENQFRNYDSSTNNRNSYKDIPSRKLNLYSNPRDSSLLPMQSTLKRASIMSSMKTNLDADDI